MRLHGELPELAMVEQNHHSGDNSVGGFGALGSGRGPRFFAGAGDATLREPISRIAAPFTMKWIGASWFHERLWAQVITLFSKSVSTTVH
jgi:hypothetical protein